MSNQCSSCQQERTSLFCEQCSYQKVKEIMFENGVRISTVLEKVPSLRFGCYAQKLNVLEFAEEINKSNREAQKKYIEERNKNLLTILEELKKRRDLLKKNNTQIEEERIALSEELKTIKSIRDTKRKQKEELEKIKLIQLRKIYSIHDIFPNLEVPIRMRIMQDEFYEATHTSLVESNKYFLDLPGFTSIIGFSEKHASIVSEMLSRIADLINHVAELCFVSLPVRMRKSDGFFALSFYNDLSKIYDLTIDKNTQESNFIEAVSLLFTNFLYLSRIKGIKLHIPINNSNSLINDILNMNVIFDQLSGEGEKNEKNDETENSEFNLDVIDLKKKSNSFENEFEIIEDDDM